ncbi:MAG: cytochrome c1 [Gemmobacter sp.]|uniref:cytochrome c1 n=1 Tax=Gemmobacter sp. TaxID=1898957 RepID=UPI00391BD439
MIRKLTLSALAALSLSAAPALAAGGAGHVEDFAFSFEGPFGTYDQMQLQRGLQVFTEVCSACHGLKFVPIRSLADAGGPQLPADQVRAYAANLAEITDKESGEDRPRVPTDPFPGSSLSNAPDLSLMAKSRAGFHGPYGLGINQFLRGIGGPEYIASLLTGYQDNPACAPDGIDGFYYNTAFAAGAVPEGCKDEKGVSTVPGSWIAMAPPLSDGQVEYADGHGNDVHHMAQDVAAFLMWTAEPKMMARKQAGFTAVIFLIVLTSLLYLTNKKLWSGVKGKKLHA